LVDEIPLNTFDLIIADEGHRMKSSDIQTSLAVKKLECRKRIILSGTPIQVRF